MPENIFEKNSTRFVIWSIYFIYQHLMKEIWLIFCQTRFCGVIQIFKETALFSGKHIIFFIKMSIWVFRKRIC